MTIVVAYLLRQNPHHTVSSALSLIRESRPIAEPNDGFMAQLELYKAMGCPRDIDAHPKYQRWLYQKEVDLALAAGMAPEHIRFEDEQTQEGGIVGEKDVELRCRKCRYVIPLFQANLTTLPTTPVRKSLFDPESLHILIYSKLTMIRRRTLATSSYLDTHIPTPPKTTPNSQTGPISSLTPTLPSSPPRNACTHHFLLPLSWMRPELEQGLLNGRLECPNAKCGAQIGRYAWQGMRCSCGVWVCPAFSLQKGRVDEVVKRGVARGLGKDGFRIAEVGEGGGGGIRLPPGMKGRESL